VSAVAYGATTFTTYYSFNKPGDDDRNYGSLIRDNWDKVDSQLKTNETSISDHISDTVDAHDASAISAVAGANLCPTQTDVQSYLDCLDATFDPSASGIVLIAGSQTITGFKTFNVTPKFPALSNGVMSITNGDGTITTGTFGDSDPLTTKGDLMVYETDSTRLGVGTDSQVLTADSTDSKGVVWADLNPRWRKSTLTFSDFSSASTSFSVTGVTLQAGEGVDAVLIYHSTSFGGGTISAYTVEVGISGAEDKYSSAYDVFQGVAGTTSHSSSTLNVPNYLATTDVIVTARSTGDNLDQASTGSVDVYVRTFTLP